MPEQKLSCVKAIIGKGGRFYPRMCSSLKQGDFGQINVGAYAGLGMFFLGGWYRHGFANPDAIMGLAGFQQGIIKVGYSYDWTISELANANGGGTHEISLIINLDNLPGVQRRLRARRYNDCLQLFR